MKSIDPIAETIQGVRHLWKFKSPDHNVAREISETLGLPRLVATILSTRHIASAAQAHDFLSSRLQNLPSPYQLPDLAKATSRLVRALDQGEHTAVYGDYDVDGLTATAVLVHFLTRLGGNVSWYLPHRVQEGYGLNRNAIKCLHDKGVQLVVTVDCGSSDHEAIQEARVLGLDVIVTDHHRPPDSLPDAKALVNPKLAEGNGEYRDLAGVGVAFYLAMALRAHYRGAGRWAGSAQPNLKEYLDLVALGTLADMVPLSSTNRILAGVGLQVLAATSRPGLQALKQVCALAGSRVDSRDVLFLLGPRLNAAGRMGHAGLALRLLLTSDYGEACGLARELDQLNRVRQSAADRLLEETTDLVEADVSLQHNRSLILASSGWHKGLLGLVAARLVEYYNKPTILLTRIDGGWEGSGRSLRSFNLYGALGRCRQHLTRFGGHRLAVGLALADEQLPEFRAAFERAVREEIHHETPLKILEVDAITRLEDINPDLMAFVEKMQPFGEGNPEPALCCQGFEVERLRVLKNCHLQMRLRQGSAVVNAIGFNLVEPNQEVLPPERLVFTPRWNHWQGNRRLQLDILDYC